MINQSTVPSRCTIENDVLPSLNDIKAVNGVVEFIYLFSAIKYNSSRIPYIRVDIEMVSLAKPFERVPEPTMMK